MTDNNKLYVLGHRGCDVDNRKVYENTIDSIQRIVEYQLKYNVLKDRIVFGVEFDVRFTSDGEMVVFHDQDLLRVNGSSNKIIDMDYDVIITTSKESKLVIPTLDEVLALFHSKSNFRINIELKCSDIEHKLKQFYMDKLESVINSHMDKIEGVELLITSYDINIIRKLVDSQLNSYSNIQFGCIIDYMDPIPYFKGMDYIMCDKKEITSEACKWYFEKGVKVGTFTYYKRNDKEDGVLESRIDDQLIRSSIKMGIDVLITDNVNKLLDILLDILMDDN